MSSQLPNRFHVYQSEKRNVEQRGVVGLVLRYGSFFLFVRGLCPN